MYVVIAVIIYSTHEGTRTLNDNLSDLKAQIAANKKGAVLIEELIQEYSLPIVQAYMGHIQSNAETAIRDVLKKFAADFQSRTGKACTGSIDYMDDGTPIELNVEIDRNTGSSVANEKLINYKNIFIKKLQRFANR